MSDPATTDLSTVVAQLTDQLSRTTAALQARIKTLESENAVLRTQLGSLEHPTAEISAIMDACDLLAAIEPT